MTEKPLQPGDRNYDRLASALLFVEAHLSERFTLDDAATAAGLSAHHFHRLFRAHTGETLGNYTQRLRVERALLQMKFTDDSLTSIALDNGFGSPEHSSVRTKPSL